MRSPGRFELADRQIQTREQTGNSAADTTAEKRRRTEGKDTTAPGQDVGSEEETPLDMEEDEADDESGEFEQEGENGDSSPQKLSRLSEDVRKKPAAVASNQVIVDAFTAYGDQQLHRGHTGKGSRTYELHLPFETTLMPLLRALKLALCQW